MASHRVRILAAFRDLHRARRQVFRGDEHALSETRKQINEEFRKNLTESDPAKLEESLSLAHEVALLLRRTVVQLRQKDDETYEMLITKDTEMPANTAFDPTKEVPLRPKRKKTPCSESPENS